MWWWVVGGGLVAVAWGFLLYAAATAPTLCSRCRERWAVKKTNYCPACTEDAKQYPPHFRL